MVTAAIGTTREMFGFLKSLKQAKSINTAKQISKKFLERYSSALYAITHPKSPDAVTLSWIDWVLVVTGTLTFVFILSKTVWPEAKKLTEKLISKGMSLKSVQDTIRSFQKWTGVKYSKKLLDMRNAQLKRQIERKKIEAEKYSKRMKEEEKEMEEAQSGLGGYIAVQTRRLLRESAEKFQSLRQKTAAAFAATSWFSYLSGLSINLYFVQFKGTLVSSIAGTIWYFMERVYGGISELVQKELYGRDYDWFLRRTYENMLAMYYEWMLNRASSGVGKAPVAHHSKSDELNNEEISKAKQGAKITKEIIEKLQDKDYKILEKQLDDIKNAETPEERKAILQIFQERLLYNGPLYLVNCSPQRDREVFTIQTSCPGKSLDISPSDEKTYLDYLLSTSLYLRDVRKTFKERYNSIVEKMKKVDEKITEQKVNIKAGRKTLWRGLYWTTWDEWTQLEKELKSVKKALDDSWTYLPRMLHNIKLKADKIKNLLDVVDEILEKENKIVKWAFANPYEDLSISEIDNRKSEFFSLLRNLKTKLKSLHDLGYVLCWYTVQLKTCIEKFHTFLDAYVNDKLPTLVDVPPLLENGGDGKPVQSVKHFENVLQNVKGCSKKSEERKKIIHSIRYWICQYEKASIQLGEKIPESEKYKNQATTFRKIMIDECKADEKERDYSVDNVRKITKNECNVAGAVDPGIFSLSRLHPGLEKLWNDKPNQDLF